MTTPAHSQQVTNHYHVAYPAHEPRAGDPHYAAFNAYHRAHQATAVCYVGQRVGLDECRDAQNRPVVQPAGGNGLELHHRILEFSLLNEVDLAALEVDYPGLTDPEAVATWAETDANFMWLCAKHHRSMTGIHHAAFADFEGSLYVQNLLAADTTQGQPASHDAGAAVPPPAPGDGPARPGRPPAQPGGAT